MKDAFSINDIAMITGLTTRTIRTYITAGIIAGEKVDGAWAFTPEQVQAFVENKAVRPSIRAKKNAIVFDFLDAKPLDGDKMCVILDLGTREALGASVFFCEKISSCSPEAELRFASDRVGTGARLILSGSPKDVMSLMNQYFGGK